MKVAAQCRVRVEPWDKLTVSEITDNDTCPREKRVAACELIKEVLDHSSLVMNATKIVVILHVGAETESAYNFIEI